MKSVILFTAICLLPYLAHGAANPPEQKPASWYWHKGLDAAHKNAADTALVFLKQSYIRGIPDDSLYYLWAEIFLYKNVLDTALALNFSIKPTISGMRKKKFEQQYAIYTKLGWGKEATAIRDSISGKHLAFLRRIAPECNIALAGGGYREEIVVDHYYPYPRLTDSTGTITDGSGDASLRIGWQIATGKTQNVQFGARFRYSGSRFSTATLDKRLNDSTDISAGGYLRYKLFSDRLALGYTCNLRKDFLDRESFLHQATLQFAVTTEEWLGSLSAGYHYRNPFQRHYYYLMLLLDRPVGRSDDLSFTLNFSGMTLDEYSYPSGFRHLSLADGKLYFASSSKRISTKVDLGQIAPLEFSLPQSYLGCNPSVHYERQISKMAAAGIGGAYQITRYRKNYTWMDLRYQPGEQPTTAIQSNGSNSFLVYNTMDQHYYWADSIITSSTNSMIISGIKLDTLPLTYHNERRVDQTLSLNLYFNYSISKLGTVQLDATIARNFSTLANAAPIDIQKWSGEMTLTWFFQFKPQSK